MVVTSSLNLLELPYMALLKLVFLEGQRGKVCTGIYSKSDGSLLPNGSAQLLHVTTYVLMHVAPLPKNFCKTIT